MKCLSSARAAARHTETEKLEFKGQSTPRRGPQNKEARRSPLCKEDLRSPLCKEICRSPQSKENPKGPHCKENRSEPCRPAEEAPEEEEEVVLWSSSSLSEDSGYLSLHNSQLDQAETCEKCPEETEESGASREPLPKSASSCLPVLKFQEEVCRVLAKNYRKSRSYDWTVVHRLAESYGLHNVIGGKMGLDFVDILCDLFKKGMKHILTRILGLLGDSDLINCKRVSKTWMKIINQDKRALQRCRRAEAMLKDSGRSAGSLSRDFGLSRVVFSCLQSVASSTPVHKPAKKTPSPTDPVTTRSSRFAEFHEATKSLKGHESLRCCRLCGSPARFDSAMQRATCMRLSCSFDFCSQCQSAYHGSAPCQRGIVRASPRSETPLVAGSARSKRSVRRL